MALTPKEQFRLGFLLRCAEEGCDAEAVRGRTKLAGELRELVRLDVADDLREKTAVGGIGTLLGALGATVKGYAMAPLHLAAIGLGGAGLVGAGLGYGAAKLNDDDVDPEEAKRQELIAAYRMQADKARRRAARTGYRQPKLSAPSLM